MTVKRDIQKAVDNESNNLHNMLDPQDVKDFKELTVKLKDTWIQDTQQKLLNIGNV